MLKGYNLKIINNIHNDDCINILKKIPSETVDLVLIDPPYFILKGQKWDKQWENVSEYIDWCYAWASEASRVLKKQGAFYSFQNWTHVSEYITMLKGIFPYFQNWITWERIKGRASKKNWKSSKEEILYFSKSKQPKFIPYKKLRPVIAPYRDKEGKPKGWFIDEEGNRVRWTGVGNVWHYTPPVWSSKEEKPFHPTQKPLMMIERIILSHTDVDDVVLDFFSGSGTTCAASKKLGRKYIGVETNDEYFKKSVARIDSYN